MSRDPTPCNLAFEALVGCPFHGQHVDCVELHTPALNPHVASTFPGHWLCLAEPWKVALTAKIGMRLEETKALCVLTLML